MERFFLRMPAPEITGEVSACLHTLQLPMEDVARALPRELRLLSGYEPLAREGKWPVLMAFGEAHHVQLTSRHLPLSSLPALAYREHFTFIPWVGFREDQQTTPRAFLYTPRIFQDSWFSLFMGQVFWGMPREMARIRRRGGSYLIDSFFNSRPILSFFFRQIGELSPPERFSNFPRLRSMLSRPLLTRYANGIGPFVCINLAWDMGRARLASLETRLLIRRAYLSCLPTDRFHSRGIDMEPLGACRLDIPWELDVPQGSLSEGEGSLTPIPRGVNAGYVDFYSGNRHGYGQNSYGRGPALALSSPGESALLETGPDRLGNRR